MHVDTWGQSSNLCDPRETASSIIDTNCLNFEGISCASYQTSNSVVSLSTINVSNCE